MLRTVDKALIKETEDDSMKWKDIPSFWIDRINIVKKPILFKAIYRFNVISFKFPMTFFFHRTRRNNAKFYMKP